MLKVIKVFRHESSRARTRCESHRTPNRAAARMASCAIDGPASGAPPPAPIDPIGVVGVASPSGTWSGGVGRLGAARELGNSGGCAQPRKRLGRVLDRPPVRRGAERARLGPQRRGGRRLVGGPGLRVGSLRWERGEQGDDEREPEGAPRETQDAQQHMSYATPPFRRHEPIVSPAIGERQARFRKNFAAHECRLSRAYAAL